MRWQLLATGGVMLMLAAAVSAAPSADEVRERANTLLADPIFQTELPGTENGGRANGKGGTARENVSREGSRGPEGIPESPARPTRRQEPEPPRPIGGGVPSAFFWVVVGVVLIFGLIAVVGEARRGRRQRVVAPDDETTARPAARPTGSELDEVEVLARSGRYTDAVHLLLQLALGRLAQRLHFDRSLTSREILGRPELGAGRKPLSILVDTVERSWFGGVAVDREAYEHCLLANQRLSAKQALTASQRPVASGTGA